jgi:hypothetical protein
MEGEKNTSRSGRSRTMRTECENLSKERTPERKNGRELSLPPAKFNSAFSKNSTRTQP